MPQPRHRSPGPPAIVRLRAIAVIALDLVGAEDALPFAVALDLALVSLSRTSSLSAAEPTHRCPACGRTFPLSAFREHGVERIPGCPPHVLLDCPAPGCTGTTAREIANDLDRPSEPPPSSRSGSQLRAA